jgi:hypothetical protein
LSNPNSGDFVETPTVVRRRVRNYIIDKNLQLRYVLVVAVLSAGLSLGLGALLNNQESYATRIIEKSLDGASDLLDVEARAEIMSTLKSQDRSQVNLMLVVGLGLIVMLSGYMVVMTHKVAGPLYKVTLYFDRMKEGKLPKVYALRKGDQLQDFFEKFRAMDETLRAQTEAEIALYERFLAECEKRGVPRSGELGHQLDELRTMVRQKQTSLS